MYVLWVLESRIIGVVVVMIQGETPQKDMAGFMTQKSLDADDVRLLLDSLLGYKEPRIVLDMSCWHRVGELLVMDVVNIDFGRSALGMDRIEVIPSSEFRKVANELRVGHMIRWHA